MEVSAARSVDRYNRSVLLFSASDHGRVATGEITVTFRLWKRAHVKAGKTYATGFGDVFIEDVRVIPAALIDDEDVRRSAYRDADEVRRKAGEHTKSFVGPDTMLHRVQFRYVGTREPGPPAESPDIGAILKRLVRMDQRSPDGPWTLKALHLIAEQPRTVAHRLATAAGMDRLRFKANVRKLKALGLTRAFEIGYELTDAGRAVLETLSRRAAGAVTSEP
jgi:hypothetical protein